MGCDDRPQGEACNCCGDSELRSLIQELSNRIHQNETTISELQNRTTVLPRYIDCSGVRVADNAALATCADLQLAISGIKIPNIPNIPDISGLLGRIGHLESEIGRLNSLISNLNTLITNPGRDNNFGGRVDQATIDGLQSQISDVLTRFPNINQRITALEQCCEEIKNKPDQGGECNYDGWGMVAHRTPGRYNQNIDVDPEYIISVTGPVNKQFTIDIENGAAYQRAANTGSSGGYTYRFTRDESNPATWPFGLISIIHCGRRVAQGGF